MEYKTYINDYFIVNFISCCVDWWFFVSIIQSFTQVMHYAT